MAEEVRSNINAALTAASVQDKLGHLTAAKELVIHRKNIISQDELLDLINELCSPALQLDAAQQVRHFVLLFIEELSRSQGVTVQMLLKPMEALALMLEDENQPEQIARWALTTAAKSWKCVLYVLATQVRNVDDSRQLKSLLWRVKAAGVYTLQKRKDRGARLNAVKFIEVMALSLYNDSSLGIAAKKRAKDVSVTAPSAPQFESLRDARLIAHPSLPKPAELNKEGSTLTSILIDAMRDDSQPSPVRTACCNSLVFLARMRPDAREVIIDTLLDLVSSQTKDMALMQAVKTNSIMLLKSIVPDEKAIDNNPLLPKVVTILRTLKADEHIGRHLDPLRKRKQMMDQESEDIKRRMKDYPPQKNRIPTEGLHLLPIETLARLLVENAVNVPKDPPPGHKSRPQKETPVLVGPTGLPLKLERVMALVRAVETGRGILNLPKPLQDLKAVDLPPNEALKLREMAFERVCQASADVLKLGKKSRGFGWSEQSHETCSMVAARLACDIDTDAEFVDGELRTKLIDKLLSGQADTSRNAAGQVVLEDEVPTMAALHIEFAAERTKQGMNQILAKGRYESFINQLVSKLLEDPQKNARRLSRILREAPSVPEATLRLVLVPCEQPTVYQPYFSLMKELIIARPTLRRVLLDVLLSYATRPEVGIWRERRPDAVRVIANKVYRGLEPKWTAYIKSYALETLNSLTFSLDEIPTTTKEAREIAAQFVPAVQASADSGPRVALGGISVEEEKAEILARLTLYIALCASDVSLLSDLFKSYGRLRINIRAAESGSDVQPGDAIKIKQRITRMLDLFHSETDKLWERLADIHTPLQKTFALINDFDDGSQDLALRACYIFAKRDPDASVIPLCSVRAAGTDLPVVETDARFLVPIVGSLGKDEAFSALRAIALKAEPGKAKEEVRKGLDNILNGTLGRTLEPSELLVFLASMDCGDNMQALVGATDAFLEQKSLLNERVMRQAFEELSDLERLPVVLLRIVISAYRTLPTLKMDALHVLQRLAEREVWNNEDLWKGFVILASKLLPESLELILRLPDDVFKEFVTETEKTNKTFKELLRNAARLNIQLMETLTKPQEGTQATEGTESGMDVEGESAETKGRPILSAFAKEYLGL